MMTRWICPEEAESVADAKRRLAKRSGTNPRDDGVAVANHAEAKELAEYKKENSNLARCYLDLSRQLAEAQQRSDLNAAALECYSTEQARLRKELAEAQGVIERQRKGLEAAEQWLSGWASAEPYISAIRAAISPPQEQHPAALQTGEKP